LRSPLPQRVLNIDTNEKADEYRLMVSAAERDFLIAVLASPPKPDDIAGLIEQLRARKGTWMEAITVMESAADTLTAQQKRIVELEQLNTEINYNLKDERQRIDELEDDGPGTPLGRLAAIAAFAIERKLCTGMEAKAPEVFVMERVEELEADRNHWREAMHNAMTAADMVKARAEKAESERDGQIVNC
jgi:hypothetical protein